MSYRPSSTGADACANAANCRRTCRWCLHDSNLVGEITSHHEPSAQRVPPGSRDGLRQGQWLLRRHPRPLAAAWISARLIVGPKRRHFSSVGWTGPVSYTQRPALMSRELKKELGPLQHSPGNLPLVLGAILGESGMARTGLEIATGDVGGRGSIGGRRDLTVVSCWQREEKALINGGSWGGKWMKIPSRWWR
ncbi:hypothetical protein HDV57DRAFT_490778 [Trichoderma longibrachiatum]